MHYLIIILFIFRGKLFLVLIWTPFFTIISSVRNMVPVLSCNFHACGIFICQRLQDFIYFLHVNMFSTGYILERRQFLTYIDRYSMYVKNNGSKICPEYRQKISLKMILINVDDIDDTFLGKSA